MIYLFILFLSLPVFGAGHEEHGGHGEDVHDHGHREENERVGPGKGILAASEDAGFQLSPEAVKNFGLETKLLEGAGPWIVPFSARLLAGEEVNLFRLRKGFYKRVDFTVVKRSGDSLSVSGEELRAGDSIIIHGIGFLRIAEITAFGGAPEGHSH